MSKVNRRIFVEKKPGFQTQAQDLYHDLKENLGLKIDNVRLILTYDVFDIDEQVLQRAEQTVFAEVMVDDLTEDFDTGIDNLIAMETLPGQYDQRADSAMQCIKLLNHESTCVITCGRIVILEGKVSSKQLALVSNYLINPIEMRVKDLSILAQDENVEVTPLEKYDDFIEMSTEQVKHFVKDKGLAMSNDDLLLVQDYFKNQEKRNPTETEIRVLDTYWSDHCRHTTFETEIKNVTFSTTRFNEQIQRAYNRYIELRNQCKRQEKPITLMDLATINSRYLRSIGKCEDIEISNEINACSVYIDVDHNGQTEKWLLQFKNETHNHPTEIEPFGGASTCIGGAIRDPLSGRSYVYQAMRITGSGNVFTPMDKTLEGKLAQRVISKKSAAGNSSYGNQIGLPTTFVKEIYHDDYVAKHMEVGAVVGAVKKENVVRIEPEKGDVVILLGGRTGRDGIGGATGSSKEHTNTSLEKCASEVQKGNAPEERKIQRLFRNAECTKLIKKCNDFGAGGVCVAIGELAEGLEINLDAVRTKYAGLNATEIAISESQERMAVVVKQQDASKFIELANGENLEAYQVATVTDTKRLIMHYHNEKVVDISRAFVDTAGVRQTCDANIATSDKPSPFTSIPLSTENVMKVLKDMNVASQKGLVEMFDASIGATTVMMPYGGKYQLTPTQVSIQKIPVIDGKTKTCSMLAYGFIPTINEYSPYIGAQYSVLLSVAKMLSAGAQLNNIYFSFQEYFERMGSDPVHWGTVLESLLGAMSIQDYFNRPAIGGKDSMSGTFNDIHVPPTLISFACCKANVDDVVTPEIKEANHQIGIFLPSIDEDGLPDLASYKTIFNQITNLIQDKKVLSSYVCEEGGVIAALMKMAFGNRVGLDIDTNIDLMKLTPGAIIVETASEINAPLYYKLGKTTTSNVAKVNGHEIDLLDSIDAWNETFEELYPKTSSVESGTIDEIEYETNKNFKSTHLVDEVKVVIPVFPGTNCEYDMARAFNDEGATTKIVVFRNLDAKAIDDSIKEFASAIKESQILALPGGFSSGDEPDGSAKFIVNVLQNSIIKEAIEDLKSRDGLILGICNGFQALIKSGLLPYGQIQTLTDDDATLTRNDINRHISTMVYTRNCSNNSPWLSDNKLDDVNCIAISHGEGKFVVNEKELTSLLTHGQVAFQYCDNDGNVSMNPQYCVNGSTYAIEGIVSADGHVLGKMGHSERYTSDVFKNITGNKKQNIFRNGVNYFLKEAK